MKGNVKAAPNFVPRKLDMNIPFSAGGAHREIRLWHVLKKNPYEGLINL